MRKGIKKWHSKLAKINQIQKRNNSLIHHCDKLYHDNQILKQFIIDIYHATTNHTNLTIQQKHVNTFQFLQDANITNLQYSHNQEAFTIPKPHQVAQQIIQEKRENDQRKLNDYFNFNCGPSHRW